MLTGPRRWTQSSSKYEGGAAEQKGGGAEQGMQYVYVRTYIEPTVCLFVCLYVLLRSPIQTYMSLEASV